MAKDDGLYTAHIRDEREHVLDAINEAAQIGRDAGVRVVTSHHKTAGRANFGRTVETTSGLAGQISTLALYGLPPERLNTYVSDVSAVTPQQAQAAAARYFDPDRADLVVVGDAQHFYAGLRRVRPNAERIPVTELNLDSETLR